MKRSIEEEKERVRAANEKWIVLIIFIIINLIVFLFLENRNKSPYSLFNFYIIGFILFLLGTVLPAKYYNIKMYHIRTSKITTILTISFLFQYLLNYLIKIPIEKILSFSIYSIIFNNIKNYAIKNTTKSILIGVEIFLLLVILTCSLILGYKNDKKKVNKINKKKLFEERKSDINQLNQLL